jgi:hypothetical protein
MFTTVSASPAPAIAVAREPLPVYLHTLDMALHLADLLSRRLMAQSTMISAKARCRMARHTMISVAQRRMGWIQIFSMQAHRGMA